MRFVALAVAVAMFAPAAQAQAPALQRIDSGLTNLAFSGVVLVAQHGHVTFEHAYRIRGTSCSG